MDKEIGLIDELYLIPAYRKKGIGKLLTNKLLNWFRDKNIKWSIVVTHARDVPANKYWKHFGYEKYNVKYRIKL